MSNTNPQDENTPSPPQEDTSDEQQFARDNAELEELTESDFPGYFSERDGRLYQAEDAASPYPLPVDTPENQRVSFLHKALLQVVGAHYITPVEHILAPQVDQEKTVVDIGCGLGEWVTAMAREFRHVSFHGLDIVPIATRYPEDNAQFEIHDIGEPTRWPAASVDMVHARSVFMTVRDYATIINEASRILKPGGIFLSGEWGYFPAFDSSFPQSRIPAALTVPALGRFYQIFLDILTARGIVSPVATTIADRLYSSGSFRLESIEEHIFYLPIGTWSTDQNSQRLGMSNRAALRRFMDSVRPLFIGESGMDLEDIEQLYRDCLTEMHTVQGLVSYYYLVPALKA